MARFSGPPQKRNSSKNNPKNNSGRPAPKPDAIPKDYRIVIGQHAVAEVLKVRARKVKSVWLKSDYESSSDLREIFDQLEKLRIKPELKPVSALDRFGGHQGVAVLLEDRPELDWSIFEKEKICRVLILDGIEDPHNLGAILRTAWLMGVQAILTPQDRSVGLTPSVHKVACGGVEHVPLEICGQFTNPVEALKKAGFWIYGLSHKSDQTLFDLKLPEKVAWVIGAEDKGLRVNTERLCDELVSIPQLSASASYNASVATAIALSETFRQQKLL